MKLQLEHVQMLLSNEHKLWKARSRRWSKQIHSYKKSNSPNVMSLVPCVEHRVEKLHV